MSIYKRFLTIALTVLAFLLFVPRNADAFYGVTALSYTWEADQIEGFSATFVDWWDTTFLVTCWRWGYDPIYGLEFCEEYTEHVIWPAVAAQLWSPEGNLAGGGFFSSPLSAVTPYWGENGGTGTWVAIGEHFTMYAWWGWYRWDPYWGYLLIGTGGGELSALFPAVTVAQVNNQCPNPDLDPIIAEYRTQTPRVEYIPRCNDFRTLPNENSVFFGWADFANEHDYDGLYALIGPPLESGIDAIQQAWYNLGNGNLWTISGYRNPIHNRVHLPQLNPGDPPGAVNSRHIYGDAIDFVSDSSTWESLRNTAKAQNPVPCAEPNDISGDGHVHVDYRTVEGVLNRRGTVCPARW